MTEAEWLGHAVPGLMLRHLGDGVSERKLRLFACNCAELVWRSMLQRDVPTPLEFAWAAADGAVSGSELAAAAQESVGPPPRGGADLTEWHVAQVLESAFRPKAPRVVANLRHAAEALAERLASDNNQDTARASQEARTTLALFLRDIFGNPFCHVTFSLEWRTDTAVALARQMYESREFSTMPILADALQDAGCDCDDILDHCRDANATHVRGCWAVDLVLSKE
jgi:hypothetical protein